MKKRKPLPVDDATLAEMLNGQRWLVRQMESVKDAPGYFENKLGHARSILNMLQAEVNLRKGPEQVRVFKDKKL